MKRGIGALFLVALAQGGGAEEPQPDAAKLLRQSCNGCHSSVFGGKPEAVYTRSNRRATSMQVLTDQVRLWNSSAGAKWSDADIDRVAQYLNENYYKLN